MLTYNYDGKVALVTGAGSGIGRATALAFARAGAQVVHCDIHADNGHETQRLIEAEGGTGLFVSADVTKPKDVERLVAAAVAFGGKIDCALNNAGIEMANPNRIHSVPAEDWERVIDINQTGVFLCLKHELGQMLRQPDGGSIVNISSANHTDCPPGISAYSASKAAVSNLTRTAALEYGRDNIRINAIAPGAIATPMLDRTAQLNGDVFAEYLRNYAPIGRFAQPEEVAAAVLWLCSSGASYVHGVVLAVDGGRTAGAPGTEVA